MVPPPNGAPLDSTWPTPPPPVRKHTGLKIGLIVAICLFIPVGCTAALVGMSNDTTNHDVTPDKTSSVQTAEAKGLPAPAGVKVSGSYATVLQVKSFKPRRDELGAFTPTVRLKNLSKESGKYISLKVVALRGEDVVATADGVIESIDPGQTVTTEPFTGDDFPKNTDGITYEIELD